MGEAEELEKMIQTLSVEQQAGCLRFVLGYMSGKPEWPALKEAVDFYVRGSKIGPFQLGGQHESV